MIRLDLKIQEVFVCVILQDIFCVVNIPFVRMVKFQFLSQFPVDNLHQPQLYLVLFSFCANLRHSLIMWMMVSSQSQHNPHLLFCCLIYFRFDMVGLYNVCAAIRRNSVSLLRFPFLSHVHVFPCEIALVSRLKRPQSYFRFHFCFLVIVVLRILVSLALFLVAVISLLPCFSM